MTARISRRFLVTAVALVTVAGPMLAVGARAAAGDTAWIPNLPQVGPPCLAGVERLDLRPDGVLRCPALPVEVTFPVGFELKRVEDRGGASLLTVGGGGALALNYTVTTWRADDPSTDEEIDRAQEQLLHMLSMIEGPKILTRANAKLNGALRARAITFTDRQGRLQGEMRTFMIPGWGFTVVSLGNDDSFFKPDGAIARAFLSSLRLVAPRVPAALTLSTGATLSFPEGTYLLRDNTGGGSRQLLYLVPSLLGQILLLDAPTPTPCDAAIREASTPAALVALIKNAGVDLTLAEPPSVNTRAVRWRGQVRRADANGRTGTLATVGEIRCLAGIGGAGALLFTQLMADSPTTVLDPVLDRMLKTVSLPPSP